MLRIFLFSCICFFISACGKTIECIDYSRAGNVTICDPTIYNPVCGCNDVTYRNECYADKDGVVSWIGGPCP